MKNYKLAYNFETGQFDKVQLKERSLGGCDEALLCSYVESDDGSGSYLWMSMNGEMGADGLMNEMSASRKFQCFVMLAKGLADDPELGAGRRIICEMVFESVKQAIAASKQGNKS